MARYEIGTRELLNPNGFVRVEDPQMALLERRLSELEAVVGDLVDYVARQIRDNQDEWVEYEP